MPSLSLSTPAPPSHLHELVHAAGSRLVLLVICILTAAVCSRLGQGHTAIIIHFALSGSRWLPVLASLVWAVGWYALLAPALGLPTSWGWCSFTLFTLLTAVVRRPKAISIGWGLLQVATHQSARPRARDA